MNYRKLLEDLDRRCFENDGTVYNLSKMFDVVLLNEKLTMQDREELKHIIDATKSLNDDEAASTIAAVLIDKNNKDKNESLNEEEQLYGQYEVFIYGQDRHVRKPLASFDSEIEAEDYCNEHDWEYVDPETTFTWKMDYRKVPNKEIETNKEIYGFELNEKLVDVPQEIVDKLLKILEKYGFILDDSIGHENPIRSAIFGDVHIQVINPDSYIDDDEISFNRQMETYVSRNMIDEISRLDDEYNCPITWNFGPNNKGQVTGGLDIMKQYVPDETDECLHEKLDLSDYEELTYPLRDGGKNYQLFRKLENGKGKWAAAPMEMGDVKYDDAFEITYDQARGFEPINNIGRLSRDLGKVLLPKRESINEASYGGAYDIEDDMFFTKEELMEFGYDLVEQFSAWSEGDCELSDLYMTSPVDLVMEVSDEDGAEHQAKIKIDMRKIKLPKDIYKYSDIILKQWKDSYNEYHEYDEELDESKKVSFDIIVDDEHFTLNDEEADWALEDISAVHVRPSDVAVYESTADADYFILTLKDGTKKAWYIHSGMYIPDKEFNESLDDEEEYTDFIKNNINSNKNFDYKKYGKYFDKEGKLIPELEDEYTNLIKTSNLNEDYFRNIEKEVRNFTHDYELDYGEFVPSKFDADYLNDLFDELKSKGYTYSSIVKDHSKPDTLDNYTYTFEREKELDEDTVKTSKGKWVNKGKEGTHGEFATKKAADAQRKAMFANGFKESYQEIDPKNYDKYRALLIINHEGGNSAQHLYDLVMKYQPDAEEPDDMTDETIEKVYDELVSKYQKELDKYGDDAEVDYVAIKALKLDENLTESSELTDEDGEDFYKLEEKFLTKSDVEAARFIIKHSINPKEIEAAQKTIKSYKEQQKEFRNESLNEEEEYYTHLIDEDDTADINEFVNAVEIKKVYDLVDNKALIDSLYNKYVSDYKKFPRSSSRDSLDQKYSKDHGRFYTKWKNVIDKCKDIIKNYHVTGYGKLDYIVIKLLDELKAMEYNFPYGWKYDVNESLNEDYSVGYVKGHPYNQDMIYSVSIEGPYDNRDGEKYNHVNLTLVCGKDYVDSYEYDGQAWVDAEQFVDDVQSEVLVWYPESESLNDVFEENEYVKCGLPHTIWHYDEEKDNWHREYTNESLKEAYGEDLSDIPLVDKITFINKKVNGMPGIYNERELVNVLNNVGKDKFKIRTTKFGSNVSDADIKDSWMSLKRKGWNISKAFDNSLDGFKEVYVCTKNINESLNEELMSFGEFCDVNDPDANLSDKELEDLYKYYVMANSDNSLEESVIPDDAKILDSGYCDKHEWGSTKKEQIEKYSKEYPDVKCVLQTSDTPGLRMWITYTSESLKEDYQHKDDEWGDPYTYDEVERELKKITNDFTVEGTIRCYWEQEKEYGKQVLSQHYEIVEVSDGRTGSGQDMSWVIVYADPK